MGPARDVVPVNNFETNNRTGGNGFRAAPRAEMTRRVMDIEDLLWWAYRDELPKGRVGGEGASEPSAVSPMFSMCAFGTRVDHWSREPGFPLALGQPHPDALQVEAAVSALDRFADQAIHDEDLGLAPDLAELGTDEARAMRRALGMMTAIVVRHAKLRTRPYWTKNTYPRPMTYSNGRPVVVRWENWLSPTASGGEVAHEMLVPVEVRHKGHYADDAHCPLRYEPDPQIIVDERAEYAVWWGALNALAIELEGKLASIAVLAPAAAQRPWSDDRDLGKPPRVFADLSANTHRRTQRETAAAYRMLGERRSLGARLARQTAPRRHQAGQAAKSA